MKVIDNVQLSTNFAKRKPLYALILTPTRELAVQIKNHLMAAAKYTGNSSRIFVIIFVFTIQATYTEHSIYEDSL